MLSSRHRDDVSPEGDRSDDRSYQVPADIADDSFADETTPGTATLETLGFDNSFVRDLPGDPLSQKDVVSAYPQP